MPAIMDQKEILILLIKRHYLALRIIIIFLSILDLGIIFYYYQNNKIIALRLSEIYVFISEKKFIIT